MTFYHFCNCVALAYVPFVLVYKSAGLSEYGAFWKVVSAGAFYMLTQLAKMLALATFFPAEFDDNDSENFDFDFITEFLKATVDLADVLGLYLVMQRVLATHGQGKSAHVKVLVAGIGFAFAEFVFTRLVALWVGARGVEFNWRHLQSGFEANLSLAHFITLSGLTWMATNNLRMSGNQRAAVLPILGALMLAASYKSLAMEAVARVLQLGSWTALFYKALATLGIGLVTLQLYVGVTGQTH